MIVVAVVLELLLVCTITVSPTDISLAVTSLPSSVIVVELVIVYVFDAVLSEELELPGPANCWTLMVMLVSVIAVTVPKPPIPLLLPGAPPPNDWSLLLPKALPSCAVLLAVLLLFWYSIPPMKPRPISRMPTTATIPTVLFLGRPRVIGTG